MKEFKILKEGHTVGCLLRKSLFASDATFAACVVKHPQDTHLCIKVDASDETECVLNAVHIAETAINKMIQTVEAYRTHAQLNSA